MQKYILSAVLYQEDDLYVTECPEVGVFSQGYSVEEAVANLKEAAELNLEEFPIQEGARPILPTIGVAVYA